MYDTICNHPSDRAGTTYAWVYWDGTFSAEELQTITDYCTSDELMRAQIGDDGNVNEEIRKSNIRWIKKTQETSWFFDKINLTAEAINNNWYNMNLNGYDSMQWTEYEGTEEGMYEAHMDIHLNRDNSQHGGTRKLSMSLLMNEPGVDFEGGEFEYLDGATWIKMDAKKGRIVAFPSWIIHRVRPVTKGIRRSIVVWLVGPKFI